MAGEDIIMASQEELRRLYVIQKVLEGVVKQVEAAEILSLNTRHIRRVMKRVKGEGHRGIVHKSRGRPSNRKISDQIKDKAKKGSHLEIRNYWIKSSKRKTSRYPSSVC